LTVWLSPKVLTGRQHSPRCTPTIMSLQLGHAPWPSRDGAAECSTHCIIGSATAAHSRRRRRRTLGPRIGTLCTEHVAPDPDGVKLSGPSKHLSTVCADCLIEVPLESGQRTRCPYVRARARIRIPTLLPEVHLRPDCARSRKLLSSGRSSSQLPRYASSHRRCAAA
jgi:hypothetical protein